MKEKEFGDGDPIDNRALAYTQNQYNNYLYKRKSGPSIVWTTPKNWREGKYQEKRKSKDTSLQE
ncbi:MAG: hypothetical protein A2431_00030 [Candidatus Zambryskibacteria bacterium RIFOXYC1_FULL_39_10]|uniref:Uncharacterized protein n=1 Tax=Candidatus Zambryskibacteria bacterium RIFOXYC1_FULL_39_10 TaxID=1802779 RepID=A0A1G2UYN3_9BACT|nr:MAG: hypothetical protein A2431_00030 [Candidatus Zambryskibacteria bacterium RIFOXYC1_FULL_39_10]OHB15030.1 MAG: hypothetical protein A2605_00535 [Candidatus Zambryskibacteria bacterium RIFOXYD1_FULL_39_35]